MSEKRFRSSTPEGEEKLFNIMLWIGVATFILMMAGVMMSATYQEPEQPEVSRLGEFRGDIFKNFAEFRVQYSEFDSAGILHISGEPYVMLVNCNSIVKVQRFEDRNKTDYSTLVFIAEDKHPRGVNPVLVRETYKDVLRKVKRAIESR